MFEYVFSTLSFFLAGLLGGLVPGAHMNSLVLLVGGTGLWVATGLCIMQAAHAISEFIPAIFLGAPSEPTALATLPGHRLLLKGEGAKALYFSLFGAVAGGIGFVILAIPTYFFLPVIENTMISGMAFFLSFIIAYSILGDGGDWGRMLKSTFVFSLSGIFGILVLGGSIAIEHKLFCMLSGAFGVGGLACTLLATRENQWRCGRIPQQTKRTDHLVCTIRTRSLIVPAACGTISGLLVGVIPAISASHSVFLTLALLAPFLGRLGEEASYIVAVGASQTSNFLFSLLALLLLGKARNGTAHAVGEALRTIGGINTSHVLLLCGAFLATILFAILFVSLISRKLLAIVSKMNHMIVNLTVIVALLAITYIVAGPFGMLVTLTSAALGIFCVSFNVRRTHLLGMLLLPTLLFYLGL